MDWAKFLALDSKTEAILKADTLAREHKLSLHSVHAALKRQERKGFVERVARNIYLNKLARGFELRELAGAVRPHSYVSLQSALAEWGISSQLPALLTCVSATYVRDIKTASVHITFRKIKKELFWGFSKKKGRYLSYNLAEPEKALLDWVYFCRMDALPVSLDEIRIESLNRTRLLDYAHKYPLPVEKVVLTALAESQPNVDAVGQRRD
jgi:predicted transcriptional regulator of viral defense system